MNIIQRLFGASTRKQEVETVNPVDVWRDANFRAIEEARSAEQLLPFIGHYDGYIRQAAIESCGRRVIQGLIEALVERLNDWVQPVRVAAQCALDRIVPVASSSDLLSALPAVYRLELATRAQHAEWIAGFERVVLERVSQQDLLRTLSQGHVQLARAVFRLLARAGTLAANELFEAVLAARPDIVLATKAFDHLDTSGVAVDERLLVRALDLPVPSLRARALQILIARGATSHVHTFLFDRQARVRAVATGFLEGQGIDVGVLYLEKLHAAGVQAVAAVCLTELGRLRRSAYLDDVLAWLGDARPAVREAAALAWFQLAPHAKDEIVARLLADPSPRLRKLAWSLVRKHGAYVPFAQAQSLLAIHSDDRNLLAFASLDPWDWLETILALATRPHLDAALQLRLQNELGSWLIRSSRLYCRPDEAQRSRLAGLLATEAVSVLIKEPYLRAHLLQSLGYFVLPPA